MPRPRKCRRVCRLPDCTVFVPKEGQNQETVTLRVDEYEALRLIDYEGYSQEQCSEYMGVARTTVQQIYAEARKKVAAMLVEGCRLQIRGGHYQLCGGGSPSCGCPRCQRKMKGENVV